MELFLGTHKSGMSASRRWSGDAARRAGMSPCDPKRPSGTPRVYSPSTIGTSFADPDHTRFGPEQGRKAAVQCSDQAMPTSGERCPSTLTSIWATMPPATCTQDPVTQRMTAKHQSRTRGANVDHTGSAGAAILSEPRHIRRENMQQYDHQCEEMSGDAGNLDWFCRWDKSRESAPAAQIVPRLARATS